MGVPFQKNEKDEGYLQHGGCLADKARPDVDLPHGEMNDPQANQQEQVPSQNGARKPNGNKAEVWSVVEAKADDGGYQQKFVRKGIEEFSQLTDLVKMPGNKSIHAVQNGGRKKCGQCRNAMSFLAGMEVIDQLNNKEGNKQNPKNRDFVCGGHASATARDSGFSEAWFEGLQPHFLGDFRKLLLADRFQELATVF